jgi:hypothetical protein
MPIKLIHVKGLSNYYLHLKSMGSSSDFVGGFTTMRNRSIMSWKSTVALVPISNGFEVYKYPRLPFSVGKALRVYEGLNWGVGNLEMTSERPLGVWKSRMARDQEQRFEYWFSSFQPEER